MTPDRVEPAASVPAADPTAPIGVGDRAPSFELPAIGGRTVALASLHESGAAVVVFYRGHW